MHIRPGAVAHDAKLLPEGCHANCLPCTCLVVGGRVEFTRVVLTGLSLYVGVGGRISADALGHLAGNYRSRVRHILGFNDRYASET